MNARTICSILEVYRQRAEGLTDTWPTVFNVFEEGKEYRDLVSSFQVELMKNKDALAPALKQLCEEQGSVYREYVTAGNLFDLAVSELAVQEWQSNQETSSNPDMDVSFGGMKAVLAMPEGTESEKNAKLFSSDNRDNGGGCCHSTVAGAILYR